MPQTSSTAATEDRLPRKGEVPLATILTVFAILLLLLAIHSWSNVLLLGFAAILLSIGLRGGARQLHRRLGLNMKLGVIATAAAVFAVIAAVVMSIGPALSQQFNELLSGLPSAWRQVDIWLENSQIGAFVERNLENSSASSATSRLPSVFSYLTGTISTVFGGLANIVLMLTMAVFLALDSESYRDGFLRLIPIGYRDRMRDILAECGRCLGNWMAGQALDMLIVALLTGTGLWLLGMPLAMVLGLIAGLTNMIPFIGPFMSAIPAVMFALTQGVDMAIYVALLFLAIQQVEGNILLPMIQKYAAHLPPVLTVLAIVAAGSIFGLLGVILASPMLLVAIVLIQRIYVEDVLGDRRDK